jgi:hypothetical protein
VSHGSCTVTARCWYLRSLQKWCIKHQQFVSYAHGMKVLCHTDLYTLLPCLILNHVKIILLFAARFILLLNNVPVPT